MDYNNCPGSIYELNTYDGVVGIEDNNGYVLHYLNFQNNQFLLMGANLTYIDLQTVIAIGQRVRVSCATFPQLRVLTVRIGSIPSTENCMYQYCKSSKRSVPQAVTSELITRLKGYDPQKPGSVCRSLRCKANISSLEYNYGTVQYNGGTYKFTSFVTYLCGISVYGIDLNAIAHIGQGVTVDFMDGQIKSVWVAGIVTKPSIQIMKNVRQYCSRRRVPQMIIDQLHKELLKNVENQPTSNSMTVTYTNSAVKAAVSNTANTSTDIEVDNAFVESSCHSDVKSSDPIRSMSVTSIDFEQWAPIMSPNECDIPVVTIDKNKNESFELTSALTTSKENVLELETNQVVGKDVRNCIEKMGHKIQDLESSVKKLNQCILDSEISIKNIHSIVKKNREDSEDAMKDLKASIRQDALNYNSLSDTICNLKQSDNSSCFSCNSCVIS